MVSKGRGGYPTQDRRWSPVFGHKKRRTPKGPPILNSLGCVLSSASVSSLLLSPEDPEQPGPSLTFDPVTQGQDRLAPVVDPDRVQWDDVPDVERRKLLD